MVQMKKVITDIYARLGDDTSQMIYANRLLYSLTEDTKYLQRIIEMTAEGVEFYNKIKNDNCKIVFGAGAWGKEIVKTYTDVQFACFVDNQKAGGTLLGLPVISFQEYIRQYKQGLAVIATRLYYEEFYKQLKDHGVPESNILNIGKIIDSLSRKQYFDLPELKNAMCRKENFVDAGSFDGRTSILFSEWAKEKCGKIWAFEPEPDNADCCRKNFLKFFGGGGYPIRSNSKGVMGLQTAGVF